MKKYKTVKGLLSSPDRWCKDFYAVDCDGNPVDVKSPKAVQFCLIGAIQKVYSKVEYNKIVSKVDDILRGSLKPLNEMMDLMEFNDREETTHKEIVALLKKARI